MFYIEAPLFPWRVELFLLDYFKRIPSDYTFDKKFTLVEGCKLSKKSQNNSVFSKNLKYKLMLLSRNFMKFWLALGRGSASNVIYFSTPDQLGRELGYESYNVYAPTTKSIIACDEAATMELKGNTVRYFTELEAQNIQSFIAE